MGGNVLLKHEDADSRIWGVRCDCVCAEDLHQREGKKIEERPSTECLQKSAV
jgi:hypothetical protein